MLADSSSILNLKFIGLERLLEDIDTVDQVKNELGKIEVRRIYEVSKEKVDTLINYLEIISKQIDKQISIEIEKTEKYSKVYILHPKGKKGKLGIHYGEFYLLARVVSHPENVLCDEESIAIISDLLSGICGVNFRVFNIFEFLYLAFQTKRLSTLDFIDCIEMLEKKKLLYFRFPAKTRKDKSIIDILIKFMKDLYRGAHV
ncbi:MAG: hypothetical protein ACE5KE_11480 [Methanosarcinales archaeon]